MEKYIKRDKFDFDIGYFVKSPCTRCPNQDMFPKCHKNCKIIDNIQEYLASAISCSKS